MTGLQKEWGFFKVPRSLGGKLQNLVILGLAGVALLLYGSIDWGGYRRPGQPPPPGVAENGPAGTAGDSADRFRATLEQALTSLLQQVEGAGQVRVLVTLADRGSRAYVVDRDVRTRRTEEGGENTPPRVTTEEQTAERTVLSGSTREGERPVIARETMPDIRGVLVVASGARDERVRWRLVQAVEGALGLPAHRISVVPKGE